MTYKRLPGTPTDEQRFWLHVEKTETCWLWMGSRSTGGYGQIRINGRLRPVHRWAYEHWIGPVDEGLDLDHLCCVRNCANPAHLEPVTRAVNVDRGLRRRRTQCAQGHPFDEANTYIDGRGFQKCRACRRIGQAAKYVAKPPKPFCVNGHPRTPENMRAPKGCKVCHREREARRRLEFHPVDN